MSKFIETEKGETGEVKSMLIILSDTKENAHKEFVLAGQTVNSAYDCEVLRQLRENAPRLCP
jgi:hypothetical protein